jgi:glycosyltransferase involved in cell wall biosynthesis
MSAYNAETTIEEAMRSVLSQSGVDFEFIVIDDASSDGTRAVAERLAAVDDRVRLIVRDRNAGLTANLNYGIELARSPLIARIDADDLWHVPEKLTRQVAFLDEHPDHGLVGTWAKLRGEQEGSLRWPTDDAAIRKHLLLENCFIHASVVFRTDLVRKLGGYVSGTYCEDYELWLRVGQHAKFANLGEDLMTYTVSSTGISKSKRKRQIADCLRAIETHGSHYPNYPAAVVKWRGLILRLAVEGWMRGGKHAA